MRTKKTETKVVTPKVLNTKDDLVAKRLELQVQLRQAKQEAKDKLFYDKYPHVVKGSIRLSTPKEKASGIGVHGRVCTVKLDNGDLKVVATQDAFQTTKAKKTPEQKLQEQVNKLQDNLKKHK